mgnify:CR=1 FL=1
MGEEATQVNLRGLGTEQEAEMKQCKWCGYDVIEDQRYLAGWKHTEQHPTLPHDAEVEKQEARTGERR